MSDEIEEIEGQSQLTPVSRAKAGFELFGEPLRPYSGSRYVAGQSMGVLYPYIGEGAALQFASTGVYPGAVKDTACVLWLCSRKDELTKEEKKAGEWTPSKAIVNPAGALAAAIAWADELGIMRVESDKFAKVFEVFLAIAAPVEEAKFTVETDSGNGDSPKV